VEAVREEEVKLTPKQFSGAIDCHPTLRIFCSTGSTKIKSYINHKVQKHQGSKFLKFDGPSDLVDFL